MMMALNGQIEEGLDFILGHFSEPIFPRTISTAATYGAQVLVYSKEEALARFEAANLLDCRINAYQAFTQYKGINRQAPNFIFIDLDKCNFTTERALKLVLDKTLKNINYILGAHPTVLWTGNGYHIYLPIDVFVLEQEDVFARFGQPSKRFLKFAAKYLSNHKSDPNNNPSFRSCMVRLPGSHNCKCAKDSEVRIIQEWSGYRPPINYLLRDFRRYLIDQQIKELQAKKRKRFPILSNSDNNAIHWIERLLQTPISDYRKLAIWRIFVPYLLNIRTLPYNKSYSIIREWLDECDQLKRLDFDPDQRTKSDLNGSKDFLPVSSDKLKIENEGFYNLLQEKGVLR